MLTCLYLSADLPECWALTCLLTECWTSWLLTADGFKCCVLICLYAECWPAFILSTDLPLCWEMTCLNADFWPACYCERWPACMLQVLDCLYAERLPTYMLSADLSHCWMLTWRYAERWPACMLSCKLFICWVLGSLHAERLSASMLNADRPELTCLDAKCWPVQQVTFPRGRTECPFSSGFLGLKHISGVFIYPDYKTKEKVSRNVSFSIYVQLATVVHFFYSNFPRIIKGIVLPFKFGGVTKLIWSGTV